MARTKVRTWRNGSGGNWDCRIIWYARSIRDFRENIRLQLEDTERKVNIFPDSFEEAEQLYFMFRHGCPKDVPTQPFIEDLLALWDQRKKGK